MAYRADEFVSRLALDVKRTVLGFRYTFVNILHAQLLILPGTLQHDRRRRS